MKTITNETIISVHFNDETAPTQMTFSVEVDGRKIAIKDQGCDANDLADITEMAVDGPYYEKTEGLFYHSFDVRNGDMGTPFTSEDIESVLQNITK